MRQPKTAPAPEIRLPDGVGIIHRTPEIELQSRNRNKWLPYAQTLEKLKGTETLTIDLGDLTDMAQPVKKAKIISIRVGIRMAWKALGHKPASLRFGMLSNKLLVWTNGRS